MNARWISGCLIAAALSVAAHEMGKNDATAPQNATAKLTQTAVKVPALKPAHPALPIRPKAALSVREQESRYLGLPLDFEKNHGQAPAEYAFVAHGPSYALGISSSGLALSLHRPAGNNDEKSNKATIDSPPPVETSSLRLNLVGAKGGAEISGIDPQPGVSSYFIGNDPSKWKTAIPHFNRVKVAEPYPGIDLVFYGNKQQLEYDFAIAPGADPNQIRLQANGVRAVALDGQGNAILNTAAGNVALKHPVAYQQIGGSRRPVESAFQIAKGNVLRIGLGEYDRAHPLVIDPVLEYAVGFGGSNGNEGLGLAVDASGNAYVTGNTCSADFPSTAGNFQNITSNPASLTCQDAFVTKLDPTGSTLLYSDFIGGSSAGGTSTGSHLVVDSSGNVYLAGATKATDFPTVSNVGPTAPVACSILGKGNICPVGFVLKLSADGSQILFSSLLGGSQSSGAVQVKLNPVTGDVVVLGDTDSANFLPAPTTLETTFAGGSCANSVPCFNSFLVGLNPTNGSLRYSTYFGGTGNDWSLGLAFDASGNTYLDGMAQPPFSSSVGTVTNTYVPAGGTAASGSVLFVAKLNLASNQLTPGYLTLIEGDASTAGSALAVDAAGNAYFTGSTAALHLAVTPGAYQSANNMNYNLFQDNCLWGTVLSPYLPNTCGTGLVGKLTPAGALSFLTYLGGTGQDQGEGIATDAGGNIWITGVTASTDFPVSSDHYDMQGGFGTPFLAEMSNNGTTLPFSTFIARTFGQSTDIEIDSNNNVYVAGYAGYAPSTPGVYPDNPQVYIPAFVQKWAPGVAPSFTLSATTLTFGEIALGASSASQTVTVQNNGTVTMQLGVQLEANYLGQTPSDFPVSTTCGNSLAAGASCTITASFAPGPSSPFCIALPGCDVTIRGASILVANNATEGLSSISLGGTAAIGPAMNVSPNPIVFPAQQAATSSSPLYVQVGSTGDAPVVFSSIALSGANASDFQLTLTGVGGPDCVSNPVQPGTYCNLDVTFSPPANATGTRTAMLVFTDTAGDSPQSVPVSGTVATANFLNISPLTLQDEFPVAIGNSTFAQVTLQNPSTTNSVQVTGLSITGTNAGDFNAAPAGCGNGGSLPLTVPPLTNPPSNCIVNVAFTPAAGASGLRTATLTVTTTPAATGLPTVTLIGDAVTNAQPGMSFIEVPNPLNFGALQVGETSNAQSVLLTIANYPPIPCAGGASTCGAPLIINSITPGLSDYSIAPGAPACATFPITIGIDGTCTFDLVFKPTAGGSRNTTLTIVSNDPQGPVQVPVYGSGMLLPLGEALQSALDFGNSAIGVASPPMTATLENAGQSNLTISGVTVTPNFAISANNCTGTLAPQATCTISVTFTPPSAGFFSGTLTIADNDPIGGQQIVTMAGTGATGPQLRLTPPTLNFGNQPVNSLSAPQTVTLTSTGDTTLAFPANALRSSTDFILQATTCGASLPEGAACTASLQYKPVVVSGIPEYGTLFITDNATGSPQPVYMQGTAIQSAGAASTTALTSSANPSTIGQLVTFTAAVTGSGGNTTVPTGTVSFLDGTTALGSGPLNGAGQATFSTSSLGAGSHSMTVVYGGDANFAGSTSTIVTQVVTGVGLPATTTTVTSSENPSATGQSVTFTAAVAGPSGNTTVPTGTVSFMDGAATLGTGSLSGSGQATYSTSALSAGSHSITGVYGGDANFAGSTSAVLTQTVGTPSFTLGLNPTTMTVAAAGTGTTTVRVTPVSGFNQQVSFTCSGLPASSTCTFAPSTVTPSGATAATTTLTVTTNVSTAMLNRPVPIDRQRWTADSGTLLALLLLGLGGVVRSRRNWRELLLGLALMTALSVSISGCGGGGGSSGGAGGGGGGGGGGGSTTPAGTSTVTVNATAGTLKQTATFTLTVQ